MTEGAASTARGLAQNAAMIGEVRQGLVTGDYKVQHRVNGRSGNR